MSDLLELAIAKHGGWERWQQINRLTAHIAVGGALFHVKGWPDAYADIHAAIDTRRQRTEISPFLKKGQHAVYEPDRTAIMADGGEIIEQRETPRAFFAGQTLMMPWDALQLPGITDTVTARECARTIADGKPLSLPLRPPTGLCRRRKD